MLIVWLIGVAGNMLARPLNINLSDIMYSLADNALVSGVSFYMTYFNCICIIFYDDDSTNFRV